MAIYYIDPHTTTNGTGTWASPWSLASSTRTGLASNDEIRIKGVALSSLLTATSYTVSITNNYQVTITAGGGLGADWAVGDILYFPTTNCFAHVSAKSTNVLTIASSSGMMMWPDTTAGQTGITARRVDVATYGVSLSSAGYILGIGSLTNVTISDCWTDATTRVTDGTVKTLIRGSTGLTLYFDSSNVYPSLTSIGNTFSLENTHIIGPSGSTGQAYIYSPNSTFTINQISFVGGSGTLNIGQNNSPTYNTTLSVTNIGLSSSLGLYSSNSDITIGNLYISSTGSLFNNVFSFSSECNFVVTNVIANTTVSQLLNIGQTSPVSITINGYIDIYSTGAITSLISAVGLPTIIFGPSFAYYHTRRTVNPTTVSTGVLPPSMSGIYGEFPIPTYTKPVSWTDSTTKYSITAFSAGQLRQQYKRPTLVKVNCPDTDVPLINGYGGANLLYVYRNNANPVEVLATRIAATAGISAATNFPVVTTDATVYNTSSPSLKCYLATKNTALWSSVKPTKNVIIPVTAGTSYTVSGYIRTDDTAYVSGDCQLSVCFNGSDLATTSIGTGAINAWQSFSMTFTPAQTGEAYLAWEVYFANGGKSIWLSDLTIT